MAARAYTAQQNWQMSLLFQVPTQEMADRFASHQRDNNIPQRGTFYPVEDCSEVNAQIQRVCEYAFAL